MKSLQLLRNTKIFATKEAAMAYLNEQTPTSDGTPILARYEAEVDGEPVIKTLLGLQAMKDGFSGETVGESYTTIIDVDGTEAEIEEIVERLDNLGDELENKFGSGTTVEDVIQDIIDEVIKNKINEDGDGADGSIAVHTDESGTTLSVVLDESGKDPSTGIDTGILSTDPEKGIVATINLVALSPEEIAELSGASNIKEAYKLVGNDGETAKGDIVKIYKDTSLISVQIGKMDDEIDPQTGEITPGTTGNTALEFVYQLADQTYELVKLDVESFLEENEFADGLQVDNHVVSVKIDEDSETVSTGEGATNVAVLTVSENGIKVDNIQKAIDSKAVTSVTLTSQDVAAVVSLTRADDGSGVAIDIEQGGDVVKLTNYQPIELGQGDELKVESTDTVNLAVAKLEAAINNNEKVTSEALISLQEQIDEIGVSGVTNVVKLTGDETIPVYENPGNGVQIVKEGSVVKLGLDVTKIEGNFDFGVYAID
jgi:hypothetical protein